MTPAVIEFLGCPGAGKSTLAGKVAERLAASGRRVALLSQQTLPSEQARRGALTPRDSLRSRTAVWPILLRNARGSGGFPGAAWREWCGRVRKEWLNSLAYRRHAGRGLPECDVVVSDSRFVGKLIYEVADPRNAAGLGLLEPLCAAAAGLPPVTIDLAVVVAVPPKVAVRREAERTENRVRPDLDPARRAEFFRRAAALSERVIPALKKSGLARGGIEVSGMPEDTAETVRRVVSALNAARSAGAGEGRREA